MTQNKWNDYRPYNSKLSSTLGLEEIRWYWTTLHYMLKLHATYVVAF